MARLWLLPLRPTSAGFSWDTDLQRQYVCASVLGNTLQAGSCGLIRPPDKALEDPDQERCHSQGHVQPTVCYHAQNLSSSKVSNNRTSVAVHHQGRRPGAAPVTWAA